MNDSPSSIGKLVMMSVELSICYVSSYSRFIMHILYMVSRITVLGIQVNKTEAMLTEYGIRCITRGF